MRPRTLLTFARVMLLLVPAAGALSAQIDLRRAVVVAPSGLNAQEKEAVQVLVDEVYARTQIRLSVQASWPAAPSQVVAVTPASSLRALGGPFAAELSAERGDQETRDHGGVEAAIRGDPARDGERDRERERHHPDDHAGDEVGGELLPGVGAKGGDELGN